MMQREAAVREVYTNAAGKYGAHPHSERPATVQVTDENAGQTLCTRCERETFTRLPRTQAILFTIRTFLRPLHKYAAKPDEAVQLGNALRNLPEDLVSPLCSSWVDRPSQ